MAATASKDEIPSNTTYVDIATQQGKKVSTRKRLGSSTTEVLPQTSTHEFKAAIAKKKKTTAMSDCQKRDVTVPPGTTLAAAATTTTTCLPRTRETALLLKNKNNNSPLIQHVIGIDEAGRGPLCGPVLCAAAIVSANLPGITDSKKLVCEQVREELYQQIVTSPNARWAVAIMDTAKIDQINILQATLQGMRWAAIACLLGDSAFRGDNDNEHVLLAKKDGYRHEQEASIQHAGSYVVCGATDAQGNSAMTMTSSLDDNDKASNTLSSLSSSLDTDFAYALVDGNRLPEDMPCAAETVIKGDSKEYSIAAASILAKVTRDRLMNDYDELYPVYNLKQHKGYPTPAHMAAVRQHGASPIHRRSFAPLKHMKLDESGRILDWLLVLRETGICQTIFP